LFASSERLSKYMASPARLHPPPGRVLGWRRRSDRCTRTFDRHGHTLAFRLL